MRKLLTLLLAFALLVSTCTHTHNENCGYDTTTQAGCIHGHDDSCNNLDPQFEYDPDTPRG